MAEHLSQTDLTMAAAVSLSTIVHDSISRGRTYSVMIVVEKFMFLKVEHKIKLFPLSIYRTFLS